MVRCYGHTKDTMTNVPTYLQFRAISHFNCVLIFFSEKDTEETLNSHMFFTIHVYQSRVDKIAGKMGGENLTVFCDSDCENREVSKHTLYCFKI